MTFRNTPSDVYLKAKTLRVLDAQISTLISMIGQMEARLRRDGELSQANAHAMNEYRVELAQRRKRRAELTGLPARDRAGYRLKRSPAHATHVIVGDHTPEPRHRSA